MKATTKNWNVNDLCGTERCCIMSWVKNLRTFTARPSTTRNWNVNGLPSSLLLDEGTRQDSRHFNQLFHHLRETQINQTLRDTVQRDLGHRDNLLDRHLRVQHRESARRGRYRPCAPRRAAAFPPVAHLDRVARNRTRGEVLPGLRRAVPLVPLSRPLPSSGAVPCGAETRQGPWRQPSAHGAEMSGGVTLSGGGHFLCRRLHRHVQPWLADLQGSEQNWSPKSNANLFEPSWWWWWLWWLWLWLRWWWWWWLLWLFQRRSRCEMCMTTNDQRCSSH